jgi:hypothetical protein
MTPTSRVYDCGAAMKFWGACDLYWPRMWEIDKPLLGSARCSVDWIGLQQPRTRGIENGSCNINWPFIWLFFVNRWTTCRVCLQWISYWIMFWVYSAETYTCDRPCALPGPLKLILWSGPMLVFGLLLWHKYGIDPFECVIRCRFLPILHAAVIALEWWPWDQRHTLWCKRAQPHKQTFEGNVPLHNLLIFDVLPRTNIHDFDVKFRFKSVFQVGASWCGGVVKRMYRWHRQCVVVANCSM